VWLVARDHLDLPDLLALRIVEAVALPDAEDRDLLALGGLVEVRVLVRARLLALARFRARIPARVVLAAVL